MLVNFESLESQINGEHEEIKIRETARSLRGLKQLMGPVTCVWSDYILEAVKSAPLSLEERKTLVREMEADIRRAVKKDKSKAVYGAIVAFVALRQAEISDFADTYSKMLGIKLDRLIEFVEKMRPAERVLTSFLVVYHNRPEITEILKKLAPVDQANTFQRLSRRPVSLIVASLNASKIRFRKLLGGEVDAWWNL